MSQQPFSLDLHPAYHAYLSTLTNARQQNLTLQEMQTAVQSYQQSLGRRWDILINVAMRGGTPEEVAHHLGHYLVDWSIMDALSLIVSKQVWIDPQDQNVQEAFWNKLELQYDWLTHQLRPSSPFREEDDFVELADAFEDRSSAADQDTHELKPVKVLPNPVPVVPFNSTSRQSSPNLDLFDELRQAHQDARESLRLAIEATRETRQAITGLVQPATDLIRSASQPQQHAPYDSLPSYEVQTTNQPVRRVMRRIWFVLLLGLIVLALFAFVFVGLHFLY